MNTAPHKQSDVERLRSYGVQGTDTELERIAEYCFYAPETMARVALVLVDIAGGQAVGIDEVEVLETVLRDLTENVSPDTALFFYGSYYDAWKGYAQTGLKECNFRRGLRLASLCQQPGLSTAKSFSAQLAVHDRALFLIDLGEIEQAEEILRERTLSPYSREAPRYKSIYEYVARQNLCDVLVLGGRLREAEHMADEVIQAYESPDIVHVWWKETQAELLFHRLLTAECARPDALTSGSNPYARRAWARALQGKVRLALADFKRAEDFQQRKLARLYDLNATIRGVIRRKKLGQPPLEQSERQAKPQPLTGQAAIHYAHLLLRLGKLDSALKVLDYSRRWAAHPDYNWPGMVVRAELALSDVQRLRGDYEQAARYLEHPLEWAASTGQQPVLCAAHLSAARLALAQGRLDKAQNAVDELGALAAPRGFKLYQLDGAVTAGWIALRQGNLETAYARAEAALDLTADSDWAYAWGRGNALHLMGETLFQQGNFERASTVLDGAAGLRERIEDPRLLNTRELLARVSAQGA